jgi:Cell wall-active antibiotics response 4TMS YvqF
MTNEPLVLSGVLGSTKRSGAWQVPAEVRLRRRFGSAELDFTSAVFASDTVVLDVDMIGGSIELKVPADMHVTSELSTTLASYEDHREVNPVGGRSMPLRGRAVWGSVEVR